MTHPDPYMDIAQLAEYSSINRRKLREMVRDMPHFKLGRKYLVKRSVFDAHMRRHLVNQHPLVTEVLRELRAS